ncbi:MAG: hypothetical protein M1837_001786 [Sclerophora amabilis]|nr:MAG: hypothetical protein M1837_001786 [Sclerophora amabilis]
MFQVEKVIMDAARAAETSSAVQPYERTAAAQLVDPATPPTIIILSSYHRGMNTSSQQDHDPGRMSSKDGPPTASPCSGNIPHPKDCDGVPTLMIAQVSKRWRQLVCSDAVCKAALRGFFPGEPQRLRSGEANPAAVLQSRARRLHAFRSGKPYSRAEYKMRLDPHLMGDSVAYFNGHLLTAGYEGYETLIVVRDLSSSHVFSAKPPSRERVSMVTISDVIAAYATFSGRCYACEISTEKWRTFRLPHPDYDSLQSRGKLVALFEVKTSNDAASVLLWDYDTEASRIISIPSLSPPFRLTTAIIHPSQDSIVVFHSSDAQPEVGFTSYSFDGVMIISSNVPLDCTAVAESISRSIRKPCGFDGQFAVDLYDFTPDLPDPVEPDVSDQWESASSDTIDSGSSDTVDSSSSGHFDPDLSDQSESISADPSDPDIFDDSESSSSHSFGGHPSSLPRKQFHLFDASSSKNVLLHTFKMPRANHKTLLWKDVVYVASDHDIQPEFIEAVEVSSLISQSFMVASPEEADFYERILGDENFLLLVGRYHTMVWCFDQDTRMVGEDGEFRAMMEGNRRKRM